LTEYSSFLEPIEEDDSFIELALQEASIPTLIMSLIHITGDKGLLTKLPKPKPPVMGEIQGFMNQIEKEKVRKFALEVIKDYRDSKKDFPSIPDKQTLLAMMEFMVSNKIPKDYVDLMFEEIDLEGKDPRRIDFSKSTLERIPKDYIVLIIGAGMSGILAGMRLSQAGINFRIIEKNNNIGGTWFENSYPGSRVDIANHFFCYSFFPNLNWSEHFSQQPEILNYFSKFADRFNLKNSIDFNSLVTNASYSEEEKKWKLIIEQSGKTKTLKGNILISAVGQLNRPKIPNFYGKEKFSGKMFHSSRWDHSYELKGKRVGVIGTGASSFQLVPEIAKEVKQLKIFQRSAPWMYPNNSYHEKVSSSKKWLLKHIPYYARWYRFLLFWPGSDGLMPSLKVDPAWPHKDRSVNSLNDEQRKTFTNHIKETIGEDTELLRKVIPSYPPFVKRILQDNGNWLEALKRNNVELISDNIKEIQQDGILTDDGEAHDLDTIIFATGFYGSEFLSSLDIKGKEGVSLKAIWGDNPEAYLGITIPNFPNLFCLYGPATNLAHAGTIIFNSECQMKYIMQCIKFLIDSDLKEIDCKENVNRKYNKKLQEALSQTVFSHQSTDSWYKNSKGKVVTTSPWLLKDYWKWTSTINPEDFWFS